MEPFNLENEKDIEQLFRDLRGYMRVSVKHGTDTAGRERCLSALNEICNYGYTVNIDTEPFDPPTVGDRVL